MIAALYLTSQTIRVQAAELAERLQQALGQLTPREASVFCLRSLEGLSYKEIAVQLDLTTNSVGVLIHKARKRLRDLLVHEGDRP